jgi:tetratricopeptide (TPR) repeat protein
VFEYSWQLLPNKARSVFSKPSVFQGGFSWKAAEIFADAALRDLALLTDKSLIQRLPIRSYLAAFCFYLGQFVEGRNLLAASIPVLETTKNTADIAAVHLWLGMIEIRTGAYQNADEHLQKCLVLFQELEKPIQIANTLNDLGVSAHHQGKLKEAEAYYRQSLAISRRNQHYRGQANGINNLGSLYAHLGDHENAVHQYQETFELVKKQDDPRAIAMAFSNLGSSNRSLGNYLKSMLRYEESLSRFQELGDQWWIAVAISGLGQTFLELTQFSKAKEYIQKGLIIADQIESRPDILGILYAMTRWLIARKQLYQAAIIPHFVRMQLASRFLQKKRCQNQLDIITPRLSRQTMNQAKTAATELKLDEMVAEALAVH